MAASALATVLHAAVAVALIVAYTVLAALGHPDMVLLGVLVGQLGGLGVSKIAARVGDAQPDGSPPSSPVPPMQVDDYEAG